MVLLLISYKVVENVINTEHVVSATCYCYYLPCSVLQLVSFFALNSVCMYVIIYLSFADLSRLMGRGVAGRQSGIMVWRSAELEKGLFNAGLVRSVV